MRSDDQKKSIILSFFFQGAWLALTVFLSFGTFKSFNPFFWLPFLSSCTESWLCFEGVRSKQTEARWSSRVEWISGRQCCFWTWGGFAALCDITRSWFLECVWAQIPGCCVSLLLFWSFYSSGRKQPRLLRCTDCERGTLSFCCRRRVCLAIIA